MIKAIIFDLDGVIVSTDELHYQAWKHMADIEGIYFDRNINNRLRGVSRRDSLEIILEKSSIIYNYNQKRILTDFKNHYYRELLKQLSPKDILPNVKDVLLELRKNKILLAIGSSSKNSKFILQQIGLDTFFDAVADGNDVENSKPAPDVFLKAAERLGIDPSFCGVVEDAEAGIIAAKAAGMLGIAISDATKSPYANYSLTDIKELLTIV